MLILKNSVKFNSADDLKILEEVYNEITNRKYTRFDGDCGSCVKEALIISNNYKKRELKNAEVTVNVEDVKDKVADRMAKARAGRKKKNG